MLLAFRDAVIIIWHIISPHIVQAAFKKLACQLKFALAVDLEFKKVAAWYLGVWSHYRW